MPGFDRSGPMGNGAMTGRAQGRCNPASDRSATTGQFTGFRRGMAWCRGFGNRFGGGFRDGERGRGMGRGFGFSQPYGDAQPAVQQFDEKEALRNQAEQLQQSLEEIQQRLYQLETKE